MAVRTYSVKKLGKDYKVSPHFKLKEFQCQDGSDIVKIDTNLLNFLEKLITYGGFTITIISGYRTVSHNRKVGGASKSKHIYGYAADINVRNEKGENVSGKLVCCLCQTLRFKGIGYMSETSTHVDMRPSGTYRGDERKDYGNNMGGDFYKYFGISKAKVEALKEEDEDMTEQKFEEMFNALMTKKEKEAASSWSQASRTWAEKNGIIKGTGTSMAYKKFLTREEMVEMLNRFGKAFGLIK